MLLIVLLALRLLLPAPDRLSAAFADQTAVSDAAPALLDRGGLVPPDLVPERTVQPVQPTAPRAGDIDADGEPQDDARPGHDGLVACQFTGRVVDSSGEPVASATMRLVPDTATSDALELTGQGPPNV
jgi:hypothetical protein